MNKAIRRAAVMLLFCIVLISLSVPAFALTWDGSSSGGGGGGMPGTANGYAIRSTDLNIVCIGYRFSVVDKSGNTKVSAYDVFRNTSGGNAAITNNYVFSSKQNKKQLITNQNNSVTTVKSTTNCLYESGMSFASALPAPSGMGTWTNKLTNLNKVLSWMGAGSVDNLKNGDKVLVEPLWDVKIKSVYHSLTTTELAIYGKWLLGANSDGGSSTTSESWGFISRFSNREFPNSLYTPDGQGLWTGVSAIGSSVRATFYTIINSGYGVGIGYTETRPDFSPNLSVSTCEAWRGSLSTRTFHYGTSNGSAFGNFTYANGYPIMGDTIWFNVYFPAESQNITVRQYIRLAGGTWSTRDVTLSSGNTASLWYPVALSPTTIDAGRSNYTIEARMDYMNGSTVLKTGTVKTFYIPVRPKVNQYQVTVKGFTGGQWAQNGAAGLSGSVYVGQKVYLQYRYTSSNTWASTNNYGVDLNGVRDFTLMNTAISSSSPLDIASSYSTYTVPNVTSLSCDLITSWSSDATRVRDVTPLPIPVVKADVELKETKLIDAATGGYVSGTKLKPSQKVTPQFVYKNNTGIAIHVEGYDNDQARLGGSPTAFYEIPAYGEIAVNGKQLTVPNTATYSIWGGVYLHDAGRGSTGWESNGSNNAKTVTYTVQPNLSVNTCEAWKGTSGTKTFQYGTSNGSAFGNFTYANGYPVTGDTIWFNVNFPAESGDTTVRQYVRLQGGSWTTRDVTLSSSNSSSQWFGFAPSPATIGSGTSGYTIEAKTDWLSGSTVIATGEVKTFYIPVRPKVNRYQVTIYDITSTQIARNGAAGQSGSVYVGQKVYIKYTYTSNCSWLTNCNYAVNLNGANDFTVMNTAISSGSPFERYSSHSPFVVPSITSSLPIEMVTSWSTDAAKTRETTDVPIPVIKADVELKEIRLIDVATGAYVSGTVLTPNQKVTPQFVYKNNTNIGIFVEGYDNDQTRLGSATAVYAIPANGEIAVNGKTLTVPNAATYSIGGSVYLDGAGRGNTAWESNGSNNVKTVTYTVGNPLKIQSIAPNAKYRENTEVITSFIVQNLSDEEYMNAHVPSVRFTASYNGTTLYTTLKTSVVLPAGGENLVYFKWTVPSGLNGADITLKAEVIRSGVVNDTTTLTNGSEVRPTSQTPDTAFEKTMPAGFNVTTIPARTNQSTAQWSEWVYEGGAFVKKTYGLQLNPAAPGIVPDVNAPSREYSGGVWRMASGYGFTLDWSTPTVTLSGTTAPPAASYTAAQAAALFFPEYGYANTTNKYRSLDSGGTNSFQFPVNPNAKDNARLHFTPLWYPNGNYQCQGFVTDVWTPAGMLYAYSNSNIITITGSAYDDWYVGG